MFRLHREWRAGCVGPRACSPGVHRHEVDPEARLHRVRRGSLDGHSKRTEELTSQNLPAQPPRERFPRYEFDSNHGCHHGLRFLQGRAGHPRAEVCSLPLPLPRRASLANTADSELAREKMWSRIHLIPLLQAEEDRDLVRRHLADQAREKQLLGENIKVYNSDRYVRPTYAVTPGNITK